MTQIPEPSPASPPAVFEPPVVPPVHPAVPSVTPVPPPAKRRWPWAFLLVLVVIFYLGLKANSILDSLKPSNLLAVQRNETSIMTVLRSDELLFLVTDRIITRVDVEIVESAPWAGGRQGVLMATVKLYYGVDLEKIKPEMITEEKDRVIVRVPYPKLLDYSMDQDSTKFFDKKSGMWALNDWYNKRDIEKELRANVKHRAMEFAEQNGIAPKNDKVLARLNRFAQRISPDVGKKVEFRYIDQ